MAGVSDRQKVHNLREHNLCFAAGIMTLFTILALVFGLFDLMWGQLYQSHAFLLCMLLLVFLMGLSMLGVFHLPAMDLRLDAKNSNPRLCSYLTGLVSTFLATPCSGPLLGGVLAWAFTQPLPVLMVVFWAVGLGMSLPYLVICVDPKMANILPRPGAWMLVFEQVLGFMLLGTALYLLSILPVALHFKALCACGKNSRLAGIYGKKIYGRPGQQTHVGGIYSRLVPELQVCGGKRANRKKPGHAVVPIQSCAYAGGSYRPQPLCGKIAGNARQQEHSPDSPVSARPGFAETIGVTGYLRFRQPF